MPVCATCAWTLQNDDQSPQRDLCLQTTHKALVQAWAVVDLMGQWSGYKPIMSLLRTKVAFRSQSARNDSSSHRVVYALEEDERS
jgi:hypothetical protein